MLIAISLCVAAIFLGSFFWAVGSGQFDDDTTPGMRVLLDDFSSSSEKDLSHDSQLKNKV